MKVHYECKPMVWCWYEKTLIFDWDIETGEVSGPDAGRIKEMAGWGGIYAHPQGHKWKFSSTPLKSKTDMAVIIGQWWILPDDLAPFYPKFPPDPTDFPPGVDVIIG